MPIRIDKPYLEERIERECKLRNIKSKAECLVVVAIEHLNDLDRVRAEMGDLTGEGRTSEGSAS